MKLETCKHNHKGFWNYICTHPYASAAWVTSVASITGIIHLVAHFSILLLPLMYGVCVEHDDVHNHHIEEQKELIKDKNNVDAN